MHIYLPQKTKPYFLVFSIIDCFRIETHISGLSLTLMNIVRVMPAGSFNFVVSRSRPPDYKGNVYIINFPKITTKTAN